ncbi:hypothetical protein Tco_1353311 [Tanacetum coccineum]
MILEGSELTKEDRNLSYTMNLKTSVKSKENHSKDTTLGLRRASSNARNKAVVQVGKKLWFKMSGKITMRNNQEDPFQRNIYSGNGVAGNHENVHRPKRLQDSVYFKGQDAATNASPESVAVLVKNFHCFLQESQVTRVDDNVDDSTRMIWR